MKDTLSELWSRIAAERPLDAPGFRMRQIPGPGPVRCYAALRDPGGAPALLVELPGDLPRTRFTGYSTRAFGVECGRAEGLPPGVQALIVWLSEPGLADLFTLLAADIAAAVIASTDGTTAAGGVLDRWRLFLHRRAALLTGEEVRGLIGELVVLARLVSRLGARNAVECWCGPTGGIRDFENGDLLVEVKAFTPATGAAVYISDPLQLEGSETVPVRLACVAVERAAAGTTLGGYVGAVAALLASDPAAAALFEQRTAAAGYLPAMAEALPEQFTAGEPRVFRVAEGFPRIRPADVPAGVRGVRFLVELASLTRFAEPAAPLIGARSPVHGGSAILP